MAWLSLILAFVEPVSAYLLMLLVMRYAQRVNIGLLTRAWVAALACGLALHGLASFELALNYRPPRTWFWVPVMVPLNALIWTAYLTTVARRWRRSRSARGSADPE